MTIMLQSILSPATGRLGWLEFLISTHQLLPCQLLPRPVALHTLPLSMLVINNMITLYIEAGQSNLPNFTIHRHFSLLFNLGSARIV